MNAIFLRKFALSALLFISGGVVSLCATAENLSTGYDIILLAGQSNMAGRGVLPDPVDRDGTPDPAIKMWDPANGIVAAADPLIHQEPRNTNPKVGLGMSFAKAYLAHLRKTGFPNRKVLLVGAAWGGTGFIQDVENLHHRWIATNDPAIGGDLYRGALQRARAAIARAKLSEPTSTFNAILWHQGESDMSDEGALAYPRNHRQLMQAFRAEIPGAVTAPIVVGEMTACFWAACTTRVGAHTAAARDMMLNYFHTIGVLGRATWVSSAGLTENMPDDRIHFNTASQRELGHRYFAKYLEATADIASPVIEIRAHAGKIFNVGSSIDFDADPANISRPARMNGNVSVIGTSAIVDDPQFGNVVKIGNSAAHLTLNMNGKTLNGSYTKIVWVKLNSINFRSHLASGNNPTQSHYLYFSLPSGLLVAGHSVPGKTISLYVKETTRPPLNVWRQVAVTYDAPAKTMKLFVNGVEISSNTQVPVATPATGIVKFDMSGYGSNVGFGLDGSMIGNRIYDRMLRPSQIAALYKFERLSPGGY